LPPPVLPRVRLGRAATFAFGATLVGASLVGCGGEAEEGKKGSGGQNGGGSTGQAGSTQGGTSSSGSSAGGNAMALNRELGTVSSELQRLTLEWEKLTEAVTTEQTE
jgi:hypothetical protein